MTSPSAIGGPDSDALDRAIEQLRELVGSGEMEKALDLYSEKLDTPLMRLGRYQDIIDCLETMLPEAIGSRASVGAGVEEPGKRGNLLVDLAVAYGYLGFPSRAERLLDQAARLCRPKSKAYWSRVGSRSYFLLCLGRMAEAETFCTRALAQSGQEALESRYVHLRRGLLLSYRSEFDAAKLELGSVQPDADDNRDTQLTSHLYCYRAMRAEMIGELELALVCARRACRFAVDARQELRAKILLARVSALASDGASRQRSTILAESRRQLEEALASSRMIRSVELEVDVLLASSLVASSSGVWDEALRQATEALSLANDRELRLKQAEAHLQIARVYRHLEDQESCRRHAAHAFERASCDGPPHCYAVVMREAGCLLAATPSRHVRFFISSTFLDMQAERDQLLKVTFPQIQLLCDARGVFWDEVDLRWGIPEEEAEDRILSLCLEEIDDCRPFFLGLLGERYGSRIAVPDELIERMPWLAGYRDCSAGEIEILHGVLNNPARARHALFYFRDPASIDRLPMEVDRRHFLAEDSEAAARLRSLKERIRQSGVQVREGYRDPEELGAWIEADLTSLLARLFPADEAHDPVAAAHAHFAASRRRLWLGRDAEVRWLDEALLRHSAALVVGRSGLGHSAFLANWAAGWRAMHHEALVVEHYVGAHPGATSLDGCCRQLCHALATGRGWPAPEVALESDWPDLFEESLAMAAAAGPVLLVIDGAHRLQGRGASAGADWLPMELPEGVRIVASADLDAAQVARDRNWPSLSFEGLAPETRADFVRRYLAFSGKDLSPERVRRIARAPSTANAFYLTLLLEELRQHGDHASLGARLGELLSARDVASLCNLIFARCERDYDTAVPGLTAAALGLLSAARQGLTESELCELIGGLEGRLPQRRWSLLRQALQRVLVSRGGLIGFGQQEALAAAWQRYVTTLARERALHRKLADFFLARPESPRAAVELPHHLQKLEAPEELGAWLSRAGTFSVAWPSAPAEVCQLWAVVERQSSWRAARAGAAFPAELQPAVLSLLRNLGHWDDALTLARQAAGEARDARDTRREIETLLTIGEIESAAGLPRKAEAAFTEAEEQAEGIGAEREVIRALRGRAEALRKILRANSNNPVHRDEWGRPLRAVLERARRIEESSTDPALQAEAAVFWLEDLVSMGLTLSAVDFTLGALREILQPPPAEARAESTNPLARLDEQIERVQRARDQRLERLEEAVQRLRHTRRRGLALRGDVALAKIREEPDRLRNALNILRQHSSARGDIEALASVWGDMADLEVGEERLALLQRQSTLLEQLGHPVDLMRCRWQQAETLWPGLDRRTDARELLRRIGPERRSLPTRKERFRFVLYRLQLRLALTEPRIRILLRAGIWILGPLWLWGVWRLVAWTSTWFSRFPFLGLMVDLVALVAGMGPVAILLSEILDSVKALKSRLHHARKRAPELPPPPDPEILPIEDDPSEETPQSSPPAESPAPSRDKDDFELLLRVFRRFVHWYMRMARAIIRNRRTAIFLGLDRPWFRGLWCLLALPAGILLTILYWRMGFWSRVALLPLGTAGQLLILDGAGTVLLIPIRQRLSRRFSSFPARAGSALSFACLIALIRLKRRWFGRKRKRAGV